MQPSLSTRLLGGVPDERQLAEARHAGFLALELWTDPLPAAGPAVEALARAVQSLGLEVPCVHLPVTGADLDAPLPLQRRRAVARHRDMLDLGARLGARVAVVHALDDTDDLWEVAELALLRGLRLALEPGFCAAATATRVRRLADRLGSGHGLCLDLSSVRPVDPRRLAGEDWALRWLEISGVRAGSRHHAPDDSDVDLLPWVEAAQALPWGAYEVTVSGRPGPAELRLLLARIAAWHRQSFLRPDETSTFLSPG